MSSSPWRNGFSPAEFVGGEIGWRRATRDCWGGVFAECWWHHLKCVYRISLLQMFKVSMKDSQGFGIMWEFQSPVKLAFSFLIGLERVLGWETLNAWGCESSGFWNYSDSRFGHQYYLSDQTSFVRGLPPSHECIESCIFAWHDCFPFGSRTSWALIVECLLAKAGGFWLAIQSDLCKCVSTSVKTLCAGLPLLPKKIVWKLQLFGLLSKCMSGFTWRQICYCNPSISINTPYMRDALTN